MPVDPVVLKMSATGLAQAPAGVLAARTGGSQQQVGGRIDESHGSAREDSQLYRGG